MSIHQLSAVYESDEDRIRVRVRTRSGEIYEAWLTRRLMSRLWAPLQQAVDDLSAKARATQSVVTPEAREMMAEAARENSRAQGNFAQPFVEESSSRPLGERPMLATAVTLAPEGQNILVIALRDTNQRELALRLTEELAHNTVTLLEQAVSKSEWGLKVPTNSAPRPALLN